MNSDALGGLAMILLALAILALFIGFAYRIVKALISAVWKGRPGLNPQSDQGRVRLLSLVCLVLAAAAAVTLVQVGFDELGALASVGLIVVCVALGYAGLRLMQRAKRYEAQLGTTVLAEDKRAPVLYLRSFNDDPKVARTVGIAGFALNNEEEDIAAIVGTLGPLVAIGKPGEMLPYAGAARVYVGEDDWHERVRSLLSIASLVILRAGDTPGLWWEVEESAKTVKPERLMFLVPLKKHEYEEFRRKAESYLPGHLPPYAGRRIPATTIRGVLFFDADWSSHLLPVQESYFGYYGRVLLTFPLFTPFLLFNNVFLRKQSHMRRVLEKTLQPVLRRGSFSRTISDAAHSR